MRGIVMVSTDDWHFPFRDEKKKIKKKSHNLLPRSICV